MREMVFKYYHMSHGRSRCTQFGGHVAIKGGGDSSVVAHRVQQADTLEVLQTDRFLRPEIGELGRLFKQVAD